MKTFQDFQESAWQRKEGKNKSGGLNEKGRKSYERENPGSDLKAHNLVEDLERDHSVQEWVE